MLEFIHKLLKYEIENNLDDNLRILGTDEVGRGCIAGPIVSAAVSWDKSFIKSRQQELENYLKEYKLDINKESLNLPSFRKDLIKGLTKKVKTDSKYQNLLLFIQIDDSKKLSQRKRELLSEFIKQYARWSIYEISSEKIDEIGIGEANRLVLENSVLNLIKKLGLKTAHALIDHFNIFKNNPHVKTTSITKGDQISVSIGAASILAKVYRDNLMYEYHQKYPHYGFNTNVGYGTAMNMIAIKTFGLSPIHRKSFTI